MSRAAFRLHLQLETADALDPIVHSVCMQDSRHKTQIAKFSLERNFRIR